MHQQDPTATADLLQQIQAASDGLFFVSEADYPFKVVHLPHVQDSSLLPAALVEMVEMKEEEEIEVVELPYFFRNMTREEPGAEEEEIKTARRYKELQELLEQHLQEVKVYRIGRRRIQAFILGKTPSGDYAGLRTTLVET